MPDIPDYLRRHAYEPPPDTQDHFSLLAYHVTHHRDHKHLSREEEEEMLHNAFNHRSAKTLRPMITSGIIHPVNKDCFVRGYRCRWCKQAITSIPKSWFAFKTIFKGRYQV